MRLGKCYIGNLKLQYAIIVMITAFAHNMMAQSDEHLTDHHEHHRNELGLANAPVYFTNEKEFAFGLHVHYIHNIKGTKFGVGLGYERIFDEHKHNTIGIVGSYRPIEKLGINLSPGLTFEDSEGSTVNFALHIEASYEVEWHDFHIGPVLELAYDPEDYHISLGLHIGYGF